MRSTTAKAPRRPCRSSTVEASFRRQELAVLSHYKQGQMGTGDGPLGEYGLWDHVIYRCVVGSRAYGLEGDASDTDRRGIYLPPAERHWSLYGVPEQLEKPNTEEVYWELQKFVTMALKSNPNVLECLYTPLVEHATPLAQELLDMRGAFLSRMVYQTYNGYVLSQFKKLQADLRNHGQVKWKHVMHLLRLLLAGITVLETGEVPVHVGEHRERLLSIKRGEIPFDELDAWRQELHKRFDAAAETTKLPERPDYERANAFLLKARRSMVLAWEPGEPTEVPPLVPTPRVKAPADRRTLPPPQCVAIAERLRRQFGVWLWGPDWQRLFVVRRPPDIAYDELRKALRAKWPPGADATLSTTHPVPCVGCGYDHRGLAVDAACPECGRPVLDGALRHVVSQVLKVDPAAIGTFSLLYRDLGMKRDPA